VPRSLACADRHCGRMPATVASIWNLASPIIILLRMVANK
jgi:hypothetical protein